MAGGSRWLRLSLDWSSSDWLVVLSSESRLCWIEFLCYVKQVGTYGEVPKRHPLTLARRWGVGEESVAQMLRAAEMHGAILVGSESWKVVKWSEYQGNDAERMREARRNKSPKPDEVEPNVHERSRTLQGVRVDTDRDTDTKKRNSTSFQKPTLEELTAHMLGIGLPASEATGFLAYYDSNGWKVGRNPMKDWRATCVNWKRNYDAKRGKSQTPYDRKNQLLGRAS